MCVGEKPKVLKGAVGLRLVANGFNMVRTAFYSIKFHLFLYHQIYNSLSFNDLTAVCIIFIVCAQHELMHPPVRFE